MVTENAQIPAEENFPPSIVTEAAAQDAGVSLNRIITVDLGTFEGSELQIPVIVRDPNLEQTLEYQAYIDFEGDPGTSLIDDGLIEPSGDIECDRDGDGTLEELCLQRQFELDVPITELAPAGRCHKIELLVSSRFAGGVSFREGLDRVDIARAVWWVRSIDTVTATTSVEMQSCP